MMGIQLSSELGSQIYCFCCFKRWNIYFKQVNLLNTTKPLYSIIRYYFLCFACIFDSIDNW